MFGCTAYVIQLPKDNKLKLDDKCQWCILLRYGDEELAYIDLCEVEARKVTKSKIYYSMRVEGY